MLVASMMLMIADWFLFQNKLPGDDFLAGVRGKGVDARQIHYFRAGISFDHPALSIHCYPRKVSDVLIGPVSWLNRVVLPQF